MTSDQQGKVKQDNFKTALETIVFIMNGSIEVGTSLNLDPEATTSFNSETRSSKKDTTDSDLDSEKSEDLKTKPCTSLERVPV